MKLSKLSYAVVVASLMAAGVAQAEVKSSGSVALTTDYKFRGISQTSNNVAVQGSVTLTDDSGVYATAWASSVDGLMGGSELDLLLGYAGTAGDVSYDVGVMRYAYPGANSSNTGSGTDPDYNEIYASVSAKGAKLGVAYSDDYFAETGKFSYVYASYGQEVEGFGLSASVGYNKLYDSGATFSAAKTDDDYIDYKVAVSKVVSGLTIEAAYIGTDLKEADVAGLNVDGSAVFTVSKSF